MIGVGVIGYGYWGPNLVRNFTEASGFRVVSVCDLRAERLALVQARYPGVEVTADYRNLLCDSRIDAIAIATPVSTHYEAAISALRAGKHVLVEKPLAANVDQATALVDEAARRGLVLMVDHTFVYTGAVRKIKEIMDSGELGELYYFDSVRVNLGLFQHDVNVIWDLAVHDLSIMDYVLPYRPTRIITVGMSHIKRQPVNIAYLTFFFDCSLIAHAHVNWLAPVKVRQTLIGGSRKMIVYDDMEPSEKVKVYDRGVEVNDSLEGIYQMLFGYRVGDMHAPHISPTEALRTEVGHFLECVEQGKRPITDGEAGLRVVRMLEAADQSLSQGGIPIPIGKT
jgi:predicted dehydrogenase